MKRRAWITLFTLVVTLLTLVGLPPHPALAQAQGVTCTVEQAMARLRTYPSITSAIVRRLSTGDTITAYAQARLRNRDWLYGEAGNAAGWLPAGDVTCNYALLPTVQPARIPRVPGYTPALDQTGPDEAVYVPNDSQVSIDEYSLFSEYLVVKMDPSVTARERETTVRRVEFEIADDNGNQVYSHTENGAPFCLFSNSNNANDCDNIWFFEDTNYYWPRSGTIPLARSNWRIDPSTLYQAEVNVEYANDDDDRWNFKFRIIPTNTRAHEVYYAVSTDSHSGTISLDAAEVRLQMDTLAYTGGIPSFRRRMVFNLAIDNNLDNNVRVGSVEFRIVDTETGATVYQHREGARPYCVFGNSNNQSYCDSVWRFTDTNMMWPRSDENSGIPNNQPLLYDRIYEATMTATDSNGNFGAEWSFPFDVVP